MAVSEVNAVSASASFPAGGGRQYTVIYQVKTDSRNDGPRTVALAPGLPGSLDTYAFGDESDTGAFRMGFPSVKPVKVDSSLKLWEVQVTFATAGVGSITGAKLPQVDNTPDGVDEPWLLPPEISGDFLNEQRDAWDDGDGTVIVNSARRLFDPPLTKTVSFPTLVIKKAFAPGTFSLTILYDHIQATNSVPAWGHDVGVWLLDRAPWQRLYRSAYEVYYTVSFEFKCDIEHKWAQMPPNEGYVDIFSKPPTDGDGIKVYGTKRALDASGDFMDTSEVAHLCDGTDGFPGPFYTQKSRNFATLGIPLTF